MIAAVAAQYSELQRSVCRGTLITLDPVPSGYELRNQNPWQHMRAVNQKRRLDFGQGPQNPNFDRLEEFTRLNLRSSL